MRICVALFVAALAFVLAAPAVAELCPKCRDKGYTTDVGVCQECGGHTSSGRFKLCRKCSAKLGQCENCRAPLKPEPAEKSIIIGEDSNGKTVAVEVERTFSVQLRGNPTTGYQWAMSKLEGEAVQPVGKGVYVPDKAPEKMVGVGGTFVFQFRAAKTGKAALAFAYARSWEKDKPAEKTFTVTVEVKAATDLLPGKASQPKDSK
jgi:inhibitor of cysteine peptidase